MNSNITILDHLHLVSLEINIWAGRKSLTREDLRLPDGTLPPEADVITFGSKRIADPELIKDMETLRRATHNACSDVGIKFLGGYGTSDSKIPALIEQIEENKQKFMATRQKLLDNYDDLTLGWISRHPDWEHALRKAITPKEVVEARTGFDFTIYKVGTPENVTSNTIAQKADGLGGQLLNEIAQEAKELVERSILNREDNSISRRALGAITRLRDKMEGLSFLAGWITPLVEEIDQIVATIPKAGSITGSEYRHLLSMVMTLTDPALAKSLGEGIGSREDFFPSILQNEAATIIEPTDSEANQPIVEALEMESADEDVKGVEVVAAETTQGAQINEGLNESKVESTPVAANSDYDY